MKAVHSSKFEKVVLIANTVKRIKIYGSIALMEAATSFSIQTITVVLREVCLGKLRGNSSLKTIET